MVMRQQPTGGAAAAAHTHVRCERAQVTRTGVDAGESWRVREGREDETCTTPELEVEL